MPIFGLIFAIFHMSAHMTAEMITYVSAQKHVAPYSWDQFIFTEINRLNFEPTNTKIAFLAGLFTVVYSHKATIC